MNAKQEFLEIIKGKEVVCAKIGGDREHFGNEVKWATLGIEYTKEGFDDFCEKLNFEYDEGYGSQELFGLILFKDCYADRYEYDGSECWQVHKMPTVETVLDLK